MAKVDPFVIQWPAKWMADDEIRPVIEYLNRFLHDLFIRTGGGNDLIESIGDSIASEAESQQRATIKALEKRIRDLEESNDTEALNTKIARLNARVNKLIRDLIAAVEANAPDKELQNKVFCIQMEILEQLKVLNLRTEEGLETELDEDDV